MITVIYHNDLDKIKLINNYIITQFEQFKTLFIITGIDGLKDLLEKINPNLIFMSHESYNDPCINKLINQIDYHIVFSCDKNLKDTNRALFLPYDSTYNKALSTIRQFILTKNIKILEGHVTKLLKDLHFDSKLIGTKYLIDSIIYAHINKNKYVSDNLEKNIYTYLAKKYNKTTSSIKIAIVRTINLTLDRTDIKTFKFINLYEKNTPKTLISEILKQLH